MSETTTTIPAPTTCTVGPSAVTGERCGAPAVVTFTGRDGKVFAECAEHDVSHIVAPKPSDFAPGVIVVVEHIGIAKVGVVESVARVNAKVRVPLADGSEKVLSFPVSALALVR